MKRVLSVCVCVLLGACSSLSGEPERLPEAAPPDQSVVLGGLKSAAAEEKLVGPLESSPIRIANLTAPGSPGVFIACLRKVPPQQPSYPYSVFFKDNKYTSVRMSVYLDDCYTQSYQPFTPTPDPKPATPTKPPTKRKK